MQLAFQIAQVVSTHSRPKAAGSIDIILPFIIKSFNTQPPEGGWKSVFKEGRNVTSFNTQPPEGGWHRPQRLSH